MAAERRRKRGAEPEEALPVAEPVAEEGRGKDKGGKKPAGGGGFPGALPIVTALAAGALAFAGVFLMAGSVAPADPYESLDAGGIQAARLFGAIPIEQWRPGFGTPTSMRRDVVKTLEARRKEAELADPGEASKFEDDLVRWRVGNPTGTGAAWRPGFDMFFPPGKQGDEEIAKLARDAMIYKVQEKGGGALVGAMILEADGKTPVIVYPDGKLPAEPPGKKLVKTAGDTLVYDIGAAVGRAARWYQQPTRNRLGNLEGSCVVVLSTESVHEVSVIPAAGAAAGLAFVGALVMTLILTAGTKNALAHVAHDIDAAARGHLDTKISVGGPAVVQQIGKNAQKLAALAASGASAPPQVMVQEVVRAPVQEINEALAPSKSFQRPEELEVEATQKLSAELGNDYYEIVNVDADHVGVFVADVPQRGVKSAMHMASIRALFRANAKGQLSPAELLKAVNRGFAVDLPRGVYVTAMYAIVNRTTGVVKVASAQHLPLVFWKLAKKASARLAPEGIALGLDAGPVFDKTLSEKAVQLEKGDRILLFTDGAINAKNAAGAAYGEERFYYVVNREAPKNSAACVNFVANDVDLFHEGAPLLDDFTLVTVRKLK